MKIKKVIEIEITKAETERHLAKLADAFFQNIEFDGSCEFGSIGLDCKRPFGNSSVEIDILQIIGLVDSYDDFYNLEEEDKKDYERYARELYCELLVPSLKNRWQAVFKSTNY